MGRIKIPISRRSAIWQAHNKRCIYCSEPILFFDLEIDHVIPQYLVDSPELPAKLANFDLPLEFDLNGLCNLLPAHGKCNNKKSDIEFNKSTTLYYLALANNAKDKAADLERDTKKQLSHEKFIMLLQSTLEDGIISKREFLRLKGAVTGEARHHEIFGRLRFKDDSLRGMLSADDIEYLYDRPICPRPFGLDKLTMVHGFGDSAVTLDVLTCRQWVQSVRQGYVPATNYDIKESGFFKKVYGVVLALMHAKLPQRYHISDGFASVANFNLLPVSLLPVLSGDDSRRIEQIQAAGVTLPGLIEVGYLEVIESAPRSITMHYDGMELHLEEIMRSDYNNDGIEDVLVSRYTRTLEGTLAYSDMLILTRLDADGPFEELKHLDFEVSGSEEAK